MSIRRRVTSVLAPVAAALLLLAGCAPAEPVQTIAPEPRPTNPQREPAAVLLGLERISVVSEDDVPLRTARFDEPESVLELLADLLGTLPEPEEHAEFGTTGYAWGEDVVFVENEAGFSSVRISAPTIGPLPVRTADGITIGSTREEVLATGPYDGDDDVDGDGDSDFYGLEPVVNPDYESLNLPGQPGTDFIEVQLEDDLVSSLRAPSNDYTDV